MRSVINDVNADVWLFQEVESAGALARVMDPSRWTFFVEDRKGPDSAGVCRENGRPMTMQRTATAVRKGLAIGKPADLRFLDVSGHGSLRHGLSVTIAVDGRSIEIVNVHLKSGCFAGTNGEACPMLFEQIPYIASYAAETNRNMRALLIGGDFNRRLASPSDAAMETLSYNSEVALEISSLNSTSECSHRGDYPIDYQLTTREFRDIMSVESVVEKRPASRAKDWPSDHCPMVVRYRSR